MFSKLLFKKVGSRSFISKFQPRTYSSKLPAGLTLDIKTFKEKNSEELADSLDFLTWTFVRDEPIVQTMQIEDTCDLQRYLKRQLQGGTVLQLSDAECEVVALALCTVGTPDNTRDTRTFAECSVCDQRTKRLLNLWADIADSNDLFQCFKVSEMWDISVLATAPSYRGKGLSKLLTHEARLEGKKRGFSLTRMDCTSHYSAKLASSLRFVTLPPRHVLTFRDHKGNPWLPQPPPNPHGHIIVSYDFLI